jgi:hypothetical protein
MINTRLYLLETRPGIEPGYEQIPLLCVATPPPGRRYDRIHFHHLKAMISQIVNHTEQSAPATVPARSAHAFLAHPTRFERATVAFRALLLAQTSPCRAVAEARPIG